MLRFDYLISPIVNNDNYTPPSSLAGLSIQDDIISIYLKKNPSRDENEIFKYFIEKYQNSWIPTETFLNKYQSLDHQLQQAHFKLGRIEPNVLEHFLHDLIIHNNHYSHYISDRKTVTLMNFNLREQITKEYKKVYRNNKLIGHLKSSNHPLYSAELHTMPTLTEHAECLTIPESKGCNITLNSPSTPDPLTIAGSPIAGAIAISSLIFYSFYRCLKRNPKNKSSDKIASYHYTV